MTKILLRKQLAEKPHRRIILAFCKRLGHVKYDRLGNVMCDSINICLGLVTVKHCESTLLINNTVGFPLVIFGIFNVA